MAKGQEKQEGKQKRRWPLAAAIVAVVAVVLIGAGVGVFVSGEEAPKVSEPAPGVGAMSGGTVRGSSENAANDGVSTSKGGDYAQFAKASASDADNLAGLVKAMPLGNLAKVTSAADGTVAISYTGVDHLVSWNALWTMLTHNAMVVMCALPDVQTVKMTSRYDNQPDGSADSNDLYIFNRADVEAKAGKPLTSALLEDETWFQFKSATVNTGNWVNGVAGAARKAGYTESAAAAAAATAAKK